jgi:hypothetical protein
MLVTQRIAVTQARLILSEWRKQRVVVVAVCLTVGTILAISAFTKLQPWGSGSLLHRALLWLGFVAFSAALTFHESKTNLKTSGALREPLWLWVTVKLLFAGASSLLSGIALFCVGAFTSWNWPVKVTTQSLRFYLQYYLKSQASSLDRVLLLAFLTFVSTFLFSVLSRRAPIAWFLGILAAAGIFEFLPLAQSLVDLNGTIDHFAQVELPGLLGFCILLLSLVFLTPRLCAVTIRRRVGSGLVSFVVLVSLVFGISAYFTGRIDLSTAELHYPILAVDGSSVVSMATNQWAQRCEIVSVSLNRKHVRSLTGRLTYMPVLSKTGWVAYLSQSNWLGLRKNMADLRMVKLDGSGDHLLMSSIGMGENPFTAEAPLIRGMSFSPDGVRLAFVTAEELVVVTLNDDRRVRTALPATLSEFDERSLLGWIIDGSQIILANDSAIEFYDSQTGKITKTVTARGARPWKIVSNGLPIRYQLVGDQLLDLETGKKEFLSGSMCGEAVGISDDQLTLVYATCRKDGDGIEVHWRDCRSGVEFGASALKGSPSPRGEISVSPDKNQAILGMFPNRSDSASPSQSWIEMTRRDGSTKEVTHGNWLSIGWSGNGKIVLVADQFYSIRQIGVLDLATNKLEVVFP